jgi:hypothetical protein
MTLLDGARLALVDVLQREGALVVHPPRHLRIVLPPQDVRVIVLAHRPEPDPAALERRHPPTPATSR